MHHSDSSKRDVAPANKRSGHGYRTAIIISVLFHLLLIAALWYWYVPLTRTTSETGDAAAITQSERVEQERAKDPADEPRVVVAPEPDPIVPAAQIDASIQSQIEAVQRLPDERKLSELEKNLARLESISTPESVKGVTGSIAGTLGLQPGPAPADNPPAGELDLDTAQLHDVTRVRGEQGQWEYASVMVDSQGRTQAVPLTAAEGEVAYETFEKLKRYPMAEGIYRQLVMPIIQEMIEAGELAEKAAQVSRELQKETAVPVEVPSP